MKVFLLDNDVADKVHYCLWSNLKHEVMPTLQTSRIRLFTALPLRHLNLGMMLKYQSELVKFCREISICKLSWLSKMCLPYCASEIMSHNQTQSHCNVSFSRLGPFR